MDEKYQKPGGLNVDAQLPVAVVASADALPEEMNSQARGKCLVHQFHEQCIDRYSAVFEALAK